MKVVALQTWSNGTITMEEKSVQGIPDALAEQLIADGICADAAEYFGGGGKVLLLEFNSEDPNAEEINNCTYGELYDALIKNERVILRIYTGTGFVTNREITSMRKFSNGQVQCSTFDFDKVTRDGVISFLAQSHRIYNITEGGQGVVRFGGITEVVIPLS